MRPSIALPRRSGPSPSSPSRATLVVSACGLGGLGGPRRTLTPPTTPTPAAPTVAPTPAAYQVAIDAFVERVTAGDLTYRIVFEGSARGSADNIPVKGVMVVAGRGLRLGLHLRLQRRVPRPAGHVSGSRAGGRRQGLDQAPGQGLGGHEELRPR